MSGDNGYHRHTPEDLRDDLTPDSSAIITCAADVQPQPITWLWPGRIAIGKLSIIAGDPGLGKSMVTIAMASHVTHGTPWPVDYGHLRSTPSSPAATVTIPALPARARVAGIAAIRAGDTPYMGRGIQSLQRFARDRPGNRNFVAAG